MRKYDTVIFDLDGTLVDSLRDIADSVNEALQHFDIPGHSETEVRSFVGNGVIRLMEHAVPGGKTHPLFDELVAYYKAVYSKNCTKNTSPFPGILSLIEKLHQQGYKLGIVSNKKHVDVNALKNMYFQQYISVAIGDTGKLPLKPAPDMVMLALQNLESIIAQTVFVGDSDVDVLTAKNAGMDCIAVSWGFCDKQTLKQAGATAIADSPGDLLQYLSL